VHKVNSLHSTKEGALLDSGANLSVTHYFGWLQNYVELQEPRHLYLGDDRHRIHGYGILVGRAEVDGVKQTVKFEKVYCAPGLTKTLISTAKLTKKGFKVIINSKGGQVINQQGRTVRSAGKGSR